MMLWIEYGLAALSFLVALCAATYAAFCKGYDLGWHERHADMVLPRNVVERALNSQERRPSAPLSTQQRADDWASWVPPVLP
jgi:hypothetical protein